VQIHSCAIDRLWLTVFEKYGRLLQIFGIYFKLGGILWFYDG